MYAGFRKSDVCVPPCAIDIAKEVLDVPERPSTYTPLVYSPSAQESAIAVAVTGGLDSSVLYFRALETKRPVVAFYIDVGQPYARKEERALDKLGIPWRKIDAGLGSHTGEYWKHIIPARNLLCLSLIVEEMMGGEIWFGAVQGEMPERGGDKSLAFLEQINLLFSKLPHPVRVVTPLQYETKGDLVRWWLTNDAVQAPIHQTVSCFNAVDGHCGQCQACLRKWMAFHNNQISLATRVPVQIGCKEYIAKYLLVLNDALNTQNFSKYTKRRCEQDLAALSALIN